MKSNELSNIVRNNTELLLRYFSNICGAEQNTNTEEGFQSIMLCDIRYYILCGPAFSRVQLAPSAFSEQLANTPAIVNNITTTPKRAIVKQLE